MKKTIIFFFLISLCTTAALPAQSKQAERSLRFGITGGANYLQLENYGGGLYGYFDYRTSWQAGVSAQYKWGSFLTYAIQPELRYVVSNTDISPVIGPDLGNFKLGALELPINFQFGPQLSKIFRPFVQAGVNFSYLVNKGGDWVELFDQWSMYNRFQTGLTAGVGFDLWRFQFQCNYRWNLTNINANKDLFDRMKLKGFEFTFGVFF